MDILWTVLTLIIVLAAAAGGIHLTLSLRRLEDATRRMEAAADVVATNLAASVDRANATDGPEGAAADAALRTEGVHPDPATPPS